MDAFRCTTAHRSYGPRARHQLEAETLTKFQNFARLRSDGWTTLNFTFFPYWTAFSREHSGPGIPSNLSSRPHIHYRNPRDSTADIAHDRQASSCNLSWLFGKHYGRDSHHGDACSGRCELP